MAIFSSRCLWRSSLCSNLEGIDPEKLCRATLKNVYMECTCLGKGLYIFVGNYLYLADYWWRCCPTEIVSGLIRNVWGGVGLRHRDSFSVSLIDASKKEPFEFSKWTISSPSLNPRLVLLFIVHHIPLFKNSNAQKTRTFHPLDPIQ